MEDVIDYSEHRLEIRSLLSDLGYDISNRGATFFEELVFESRRLLIDGKSDEEVKEIIPNAITEYGSCYHEIGIIKYKEEINKFFGNRSLFDEEKSNKEINKILPVLSLDEKVLLFSKYLNGNKNNEKVYKKDKKPIVN